MFNQQELSAILDNMSEELAAQLQGCAFKMVGIRTGGVWIARELAKRLDYDEEIGELDISFYRDDFTRIGLNPSVTPTRLPFGCEDAHLLLVDDIIMSGRTIRAAMNELFDFGRPASITLAVLADLGQRELPIAASVTGQVMQLPKGKRLKLSGPEPLSLNQES
jgi:pyrimidine operon attenuation protein/uracil phosphoribosyltransferase